jgi:hypothetical protein
MMSQVLFIYLSCLAFVASAEAFDKDVDEYSWLASTTLGLQRSFTVTKKPLDATQKDGLVGSKSGENLKKLVDDEAIALGLEIDESAPTWLADATTLGLQRGFKITKKLANPSTNVLEDPAPSWTASTTLGLQRGFQVQKKSIISDDEITDPSWEDFTTLGLQRGFKTQKKTVDTHPEATQQEQLAQRLQKDASVLGLQRGFQMTKKALTDLEDELPSSSLQESSVLGLQRGFHVKKAQVTESLTSSLRTSTLDFQHSIKQQNATKLALKAANLTGLDSTLDMNVFVV